MKKMGFFFAGLVCLLLSLNVNAQSKTGAEYFSGKWSVLLKGLPDGDRKLVFVLESKDSTMAGSVQDPTGTEIATISSAELKDEIVRSSLNSPQREEFKLKGISARVNTNNSRTVKT